MKIKEVIKLNDVALDCDKLVGREFVKAHYKNFKMIKEEVELINVIKEPNEEYKKLQSELHEMFKIYADKDEDGKLKVTYNNDGTESLTITDEVKLAKYKEENSKVVNTDENVKVIKLQEDKNAEYYKAIQEESDIKFIMIPEDSLPDNITVEQRRILSFMISD